MDSVFVCSHALNGRPLWVCADHPALGLFCEACDLAHMEEWHASEPRCSTCNDTEAEFTIATFSVPLQLTVCDVEDREYLFSGPVCVMWLTCARCAGVAA